MKRRSVERTTVFTESYATKPVLIRKRPPEKTRGRLQLTKRERCVASAVDEHGAVDRVAATIVTNENGFVDWLRNVNAARWPVVVAAVMVVAPMSSAVAPTSVLVACASVKIPAAVMSAEAKPPTSLRRGRREYEGESGKCCRKEKFLHARCLRAFDSFLIHPESV